MIAKPIFAEQGGGANACLLKKTYCKGAILSVSTPPGTGVPISVKPPTVSGKYLNVPYYKQTQTNWCWAACSQMVEGFFGKDAPQCKSANWLFGQSTCCNSPGSTACNQGCPITRIVSVHGFWGVNSSYTGTSLGFYTVKAWIENTKPVECGFAWTGGGGHVVIVKGYDENPQGQFVYVLDPWYGQGSIHYTDLLTAYGKGVWTWTWTF